MKQLNSFIRLSAADKWLLITSAVLLGAIRLSLWLIPFHVLRKFLGKLNRAALEASDSHDDRLKRVVWAVSVLGSRMPGSCLVQALAAQLMLGRRGLSATLRIGVGLDAQGAFIAHAWLESKGEIIIGGSQSRTHFSPLPPLTEEFR